MFDGSFGDILVTGVCRVLGIGSFERFIDFRYRVMWVSRCFLVIREGEFWVVGSWIWSWWVVSFC